MRGIVVIGIRGKIIGIVVPGIDVLKPSPLRRITRRRGETRAERRPPPDLISFVELFRIQSTQCIATDTLLILKDEAEFRLEFQVRLHKNSAECIGIIAIERLTVFAEIPSFEADIRSPGFIFRTRESDGARFHKAAKVREGRLVLVENARGAGANVPSGCCESKP